MGRADDLDRLLRTFTRDREFCESLASTQPIRVGRLLVYVQWAHRYFSAIQEELHDMASRHFPRECAEEAAVWTLSLTGGIMRDLLLVPYFVVRGALSEAGFALRRSMENAGVLAHLWNEPANSAYLDVPDGQEFRRAFIWEADKQKDAVLKARGVQKRFERCAMAQPLSNLYRMLSTYTVHGGSPRQLVGVELAPTKLSCALMNRPDPARKDLASELELLGNGCEMLCIEVCTIHGTYGQKYGVTSSLGGEGGFCLMRLLEHEPGGEMAEAVMLVLQQLGWPTDLGPSHTSK